MIYLDNNATTPLDDEVITAMTAVMRQVGNASSVHHYGRMMRKLIEDARITILKSLHIRDADLNEWRVIFTSGGTEANNLFLKGNSSSPIYASMGEHPSIYEIARHHILIKLSNDGRLNLNDLRDKLKQLTTTPDRGMDAPIIVSIQWANGEIGSINPITDIAGIVHEYGAILHSDAVQAYGKIDINLMATPLDAISISGHKIGGPQGSGALIHHKSVKLSPLFEGGGQEYYMRAGTENTPAIVGFARACELLQMRLKKFKNIEKMRNNFEEKLLKNFPALSIAGKNANNIHRLPNTSCIITNNIDQQLQLMAMDLKGIAISAGSACSSGKMTPSHVLLAMGYSEASAKTAIRVSLAPATTQDQMDEFYHHYSHFLRETLK